jgi:hypothetical protein
VVKPDGCLLERWINTTQGPVELKPVPLASCETLEMLLTILRDSQYLVHQNEIAQKILNLHPRGDLPNLWGVDLSLLPQNSFEEVFGTGGIIEKINQFVPIESDDDPDEFPPWSSGDLQVDFLATLTHLLGSFDQARHCTEHLGLQGIANLSKRLQDIQIGPEEREKAGLKRWFWEHKDEFEDDFYGDQI